MSRKKLAAAITTILAMSIFSGCGDESQKADDKTTFTYGTVAYGVAMERRS